MAPTIEVLVAGRALQGVFGALLTPSALAVIIATFPASERGAAIGSWTAWSGISFVVGPLVGGWLVDVASWRWIFAINVPFVLITLALVFAAVPKPTGPRRDVPLDWLGAVLTVLGLAGPVLALITPSLWYLGVVGVVLLGVFVWHERRTAHPMLPLELFSRRNFAVRQPADVRDVRRARDAVLLPDAVPAAGRGLRRAAGGAGPDPDDAGDVLALPAGGAARRSLRTALLHGLRAAGGRARASSGCSGSTPSSPTGPSCCRA